jgi:hypothetical protein
MTLLTTTMVWRKYVQVTRNRSARAVTVDPSEISACGLSLAKTYGVRSPADRRAKRLLAEEIPATMVF